MCLYLKLKALMYEYVIYFAAHIYASFHSQALSIMKFNGLNFFEWSEQIQFHLGVLDLDLVLTTDKPTAINDTSNTEQRLMIPKIDSAKEFMKFVENHSQSDFADKSVVETLMGMLTTMKFDGSHIMYEHVIEMTNIAARLGFMGLKVSDNFIMQFIINSLPLAYSLF
ncbi:hypothetical protein Pfo_026652 [Paulownia fortunei]|nr:hypothetical protein Pfo_026652 [Paulownia fortunei]